MTLAAELSTATMRTDSPPASEPRRAASPLDSLAVLESNIGAIEACAQFARGLRPFVVVYGPSGWGKSHLVASLEAEMAGSALGPVRLRDAVAWIQSPARTDWNAALLLDDVQGVVRHPRLRHGLRVELERRARAGKPTLLCFTSRRKPPVARLLPPAVPPWRLAAIHEPSRRERLVIVRRIAEQNGVEVADSLVGLIAHHLCGNGRSILGAIERLKLAGSDWSKPESVLLACGVLRPYWLGSDGWDPRDTVADAVAETLAEPPTGLTHADLVAYFLLRELGMTEGEAACFTKLGESGVYRRANFVHRHSGEEAVANAIAACRNAVVSAMRPH